MNKGQVKASALNTSRTFFYGFGSILAMFFVSAVFDWFTDVNDNLSFGLPLLLVTYLWGGYLLSQKDKKSSKIAGGTIMAVGLLMHLLFLFSEYTTRAEAIRTTIILLLPLAGAGYIIFRRPAIQTILIWSGAILILTFAIA